jgi:hypothetical protein
MSSRAHAIVRWASGLLLAGTALMLAGCASSYTLDTTVQTFSGLAGLPSNPTYRFERFPSQLNDPGQGRLEALADGPLFRAGLRRDDANPLYSVQLQARVQPVVSPFYNPYCCGWGWGGVGWHGHRTSGVNLGLGFGGPFGPAYAEPPWYQREVAIIMREVATNKVVYETRAFNDGHWSSQDSALMAMFDAALQGFPTPPAGVRRVAVQIAR